MRTSSMMAARAACTCTPCITALKFSRLLLRKRESSRSSVAKDRTTRTAEKASCTTADSPASSLWMACPTIRSFFDARSRISTVRGRMAKVMRVSFQLI